MNRQAQTQGNIAPVPKLSFMGVALQRKCACGGSAGMSGDCEQCQEKRLTINRYAAVRRSPSRLLRAPSEFAGSMSPSDSSATAGHGAGRHFDRLRVGAAALSETSGERTISQPGDRSEVEADHAAEQVMRALSTPVFEEKQEAPAAPALSQTPPLIQRAATDENTPEGTGTGVTAASETAREETPAPGLIVEDDAQEVGPGQMRKNEFLDELRAAVCAGADAELAAAGRSTEGCPYIGRAFERYRKFSAAKLERGLRRYAPEAAGATSARDYIPAVTGRVRQAVAVWAATGQITGVPEELAGELPGMGALGAFGGLLGGIGGAVSGLVGGIGGIFFKAKDGSAKDADPLEVQAQLGAGSPLDGGVRSRMESAFGHDFSRVRVHADAKAAALSTQLRARAFTINTDVAFGAGEYRPGTLIGDALLAHELAHVVQQGGPKTGVAMKSGLANNALEEDADASAVGAVLSLWAPSAKAGAVSKRAAREMTRGRNLARSPRLRAGLGLQRCGGEAPSPAAPATPDVKKPEEPKLDDMDRMAIEAMKPILCKTKKSGTEWCGDIIRTPERQLRFTGPFEGVVEFCDSTFDKKKKKKVQKRDDEVWLAYYHSHPEGQGLDFSEEGMMIGLMQGSQKGPKDIGEANRLGIVYYLINSEGEMLRYTPPAEKGVGAGTRKKLGKIDTTCP